MKARTSLARVVSVALGSVLLMVLIGAPHDSASAADCKDGFYAVGGHDNNGYGVRAKLKVTDPDTVCMWSNQVAVYIDPYNWVEGGWQESPYNFGNSGKHPWTYRVKGGKSSTELFGATGYRRTPTILSSLYRAQYQGHTSGISTWAVRCCISGTWVAAGGKSWPSRSDGTQPMARSTARPPGIAT